MHEHQINQFENHLRFLHFTADAPNHSQKYEIQKAVKNLDGLIYRKVREGEGREWLGDSLYSVHVSIDAGGDDINSHGMTDLCPAKT